MDRNTDEGYLVDHPIVVALLAEGVDRNVIDGGDERAGRHGVALLAEGVDRNQMSNAASGSYPVALLAEGVDRNPEWLAVIFMIAGSPSSRRAQVEIDTKIW